MRGPISAELLGISSDLAITDPAILIKRLYTPESSHKEYELGFMPHWANAHSGWADVCEAAGIKYISPLKKVECVLSDLGKTKLLLTEAMHGAIVADALRVPWIPLHTKFSDYNPQKWLDWCRTVNISYSPEPVTRLFNFDFADKLTITSPVQSSKELVKLLFKPFQKYKVISQLRKISENSQSFLSRESVSNALLVRMEEAIDRFKRDFGIV